MSLADDGRARSVVDEHAGSVFVASDHTTVLVNVRTYLGTLCTSMSATNRVDFGGV